MPNGDVDVLAREVRQLFRHHEAHVELGMALGQAAEPGNQPARNQRRRRAHRQHPGGFETLQIDGRLVELVEQRADAREVAAAGFGHHDAPRQSPEQRDTQPVLEDLDQTPHGIGRDVEFGARRVEASQARRCFEGAERVERRQTPVIASPQFSWG